MCIGRLLALLFQNNCQTFKSPRAVPARRRPITTSAGLKANGPSKLNNVENSLEDSVERRAGFWQQPLRMQQTYPFSFTSLKTVVAWATSPPVGRVYRVSR